MRAPAGVARRYARALLDVAGGEAASVRRELDDVLQLLASQPELLAALTHPALAGERKAAVLETLLAGRLEQAPVLRLSKLLAARHRLELLPEIARSYLEQWNERRGVVSAQAVTAVPLDAEQTRALQHALSRAAGRQVELANAVDPSLLGGVLVRMAGRTYDGSVRGRLRSLRQHLLGTTAH